VTLHPETLRRWRSTTPHRTAAAALACLAAAGATTLVVSAGRSPGEQRSPAQVAALARMEPYAELLAADFDAGAALLPDGLVRDITVASDGLSASGTISLPIPDDGGCAVIRIEFGPAYLIDGDLSALDVRGPVLLPPSQCP
jgi:hypothetical protein